jgi:hypothetical protein
MERKPKFVKQVDEGMIIEVTKGRPYDWQDPDSYRKFTYALLPFYQATDENTTQNGSESARAATTEAVTAVSSGEAIILTFPVQKYEPKRSQSLRRKDFLRLIIGGESNS